VTQNTGGRVTFNDLVGSVTGPDMYDQLIAGTGDIAYQVVIVNTGRFPSIEIATVCNFFTVCQRPSCVFRDMYNEFPEIQKEFSEVKMLTCWGTPPSPPGIGFVTKDKPVRTLEDAKGMKLGQYGVWGTKEVANLGFTPVAVPPWEVYESLQKGLVDGSNMDVIFLTNFRVGEVVKYWHPISFIFCPFWLAMNKDTWNKLPPDVQKVIMDATAKVHDNSDWGQRAFAATMLPAWPNVTEVKIAPEEQQRWIATQKPVQQEYIDMLKSKGVDGQKIFDRMNELFAKYAEPLPAEPH
jgi:TRAP-type C4-dicarboxylate transport system substrate-binding protein